MSMISGEVQSATQGVIVDPYEDDLLDLDGWFDDPDGVDDVASEVADFLRGIGAADDTIAAWVDIGGELVAEQFMRARPAYVAWEGAVDAIIVSDPALIAHLSDLEVYLRDVGGPPVIRSTGEVSKPPGWLASWLGAKSTVGPTLEGWTVRQLARLFGVMWILDTSPDANVPLLDRIPPAARIVTFARQRDPQSLVTAPDQLRQLLRQVIVEADHYGTVNTGEFAQSVLRTMDAGDPLATKTLSARAVHDLVDDAKNASIAAAKLAGKAGKDAKGALDFLLDHPVMTLATAAAAGLFFFAGPTTLLSGVSRVRR